MRFYLCLLTIVFLCGCSTTQEPEEEITTGTISGRVYDHDSGDGLSLVAITTAPPTSSVTTDSTGTYSISDVSAGVYFISANRMGYDSTAVNVSVLPGSVTVGDVPMLVDTTSTP